MWAEALRVNSSSPLASRPAKLRSAAWFDNPKNVDLTSLYLERYLEAAVKYQRIAQTKGPIRDSH